MTWIAIGLAGGLGAVVRDLLGHVLGVPTGMHWANRLGAVGLGALGAALATGRLSATLVAVAGAGFCGGLTTFSTLVVTGHRDHGHAMVWREVAIGLVLAAGSWLAVTTLAG